MTGQSTVTGTITAYAGGSILAVFQSQGGGAPSDPRVSTTIAGDGTFTLLAWDNTNAIYKPSRTVFLIQVGETSYSSTTTVAGTSEDISAIFDDAPTPPSGAGGVPSVNGITDAVTITAGTGITITEDGDTITVAATASSLPVFSVAGTQQTNAHIVIGSGTLVAGTLTITLSGSAVFTSSTSYVVTVDDSAALAPMEVTYTSGTSFTITGTSTDTFRYICVGN